MDEVRRSSRTRNAPVRFGDYEVPVITGRRSRNTPETVIIQPPIDEEDEEEEEVVVPKSRSRSRSRVISTPAMATTSRASRALSPARARDPSPARARASSVVRARDASLVRATSSLAGARVSSLARARAEIPIFSGKRNMQKKIGASKVLKNAKNYVTKKIKKNKIPAKKKKGGRPLRYEWDVNPNAYKERIGNFGNIPYKTRKYSTNTDPNTGTYGYIVKKPYSDDYINKLREQKNRLAQLLIDGQSNLRTMLKYSPKRRYIAI